MNAYSKLYGTPLHWAAERGHRGIAEVLLENGASTDILDSHRLTPADRARVEGQKELADYIDGETPTAEFLRLFSLSNSRYLSLGKCLAMILEKDYISNTILI